MTDPIKITINSDDEPIRVNSRIETWAASYTSSEPLRKAIIKRTLLVAAFDERFVDRTINDAELLDQVASEMLAETPLPLIAGDDDQATSSAK